MFDISEWVYAAEGNRNVVLRYIGNSLDLQGKVLRLQKFDPTIDVDLPLSKADAHFSLDFANNVTTPLLGEEYTVSMTLVNVPREFLVAASKKIAHDRPERRRTHDINVNISWAFLASDLTYNSRLTIEIKPKWGFLPSSGFIAEEHRQMKSKVCRFCMHSWLKHRRDTRYCPLDLFSMQRDRMERALQALAQEPQHDKFNASYCSSVSEQQLDPVQVALAVLHKETILPKLASLQRHLDALDVEGIMPLYEKHKDEPWPVHDIELWKEVVSDIDLPEKTDRQRILEYVLSMTFKDCSLFISVCDSEKTVQLADGTILPYQIKVIDLDLKKISKIPYWYNLDQRIVKHAIEHQLNKVCYDQATAV